MGIIISLIVISSIVTLLVDAFVLKSTTKMFKVENSNYKKALKITFIFVFLSVIVSFLLGFLFSAIKIEFLAYLLSPIVGFFIANPLYKKYYSTDARKNLKIYIVQMLLSALASFVIAFMFIVPFRLFIAQSFMMEGAGMEPSIKDGTYMFFKSYDKEYKRSEVIVFKYPKDETQFYLKRIIGLPGEKIEIKEGAVFINGSVLDERSYLGNEISTKGNVNLTLGSDEYFVMGDNRQFSSDSRAWGPLKKNSITGKYWITSPFPLE